MCYQRGYIIETIISGGLLSKKKANIKELSYVKFTKRLIKTSRRNAYYSEYIVTTSIIRILEI